MLPDWSRAHLLAHVAGNARSHVRMLDSALRGEVAEQHDGGAEARAATILALAADPVAALRAVRDSAREPEGRWVLTTEQTWQRSARRLDEDPAPVARLAWARRREVEVLPHRLTHQRFDLAHRVGGGGDAARSTEKAENPEASWPSMTTT